MRGSGIITVCVTAAIILVTFFLYNTWRKYVAARQRAPCAEASTPADAPTRPTPATSGVMQLVAMLPAQKWDTIQNMMHWRNEMSSLDQILGDVAERPEAAPPDEQRTELRRVGLGLGPLLTEEEERLFAAAMATRAGGAGSPVPSPSPTPNPGSSDPSPP